MPVCRRNDVDNEPGLPKPHRIAISATERFPSRSSHWAASILRRVRWRRGVWPVVRLKVLRQNRVARGREGGHPLVVRFGAVHLLCGPLDSAARDVYLHAPHGRRRPIASCGRAARNDQFQSPRHPAMPLPATTAPGLQHRRARDSEDETQIRCARQLHVADGGRVLASLDEQRAPPGVVPAAVGPPDTGLHVEPRVRLEIEVGRVEHGSQGSGRPHRPGRTRGRRGRPGPIPPQHGETPDRRTLWSGSGCRATRRSGQWPRSSMFRIPAPCRPWPAGSPAGAGGRGPGGDRR